MGFKFPQNKGTTGRISDGERMTVVMGVSVLLADIDPSAADREKKRTRGVGRRRRGGSDVGLHS